MKAHIIFAATIAMIVSTNSHLVWAQSTYIKSTSHGVVTVVPINPRLDAPGERNSLGWNTGYSALTTTSERPSIYGRDVGTITETVTKIVPNDVLGNPVRSGWIGNNETNSAGWSTGYSTVTSTYERKDPWGAVIGGADTVTETKTQIVPNDLLGQPILPLGDRLR